MSLPHRPAPAAALAVALALPLAATAEPRQWRDVIYDLPQGWFVAGEENGILSLRKTGSDGPCRYCTIQLGPLRPGTTDPVSVLQFQTAIFTDPKDRASIKVLEQPKAAPIGPNPGALAGLMAGGDMQVVVAIARKGGVQLFGFHAPIIDDTDLPEATATLSDVALPLFAALKFAGPDDPGLMPPPVPGDLSGLWWGWRAEWVMNLDLTQSYEVRQRRILFWTNGYFHDGTPPGGLAALDPVALRAAGDMDFGTYRTGPDGLTLHFADGRTEVLPRGGTGFMDGEREMAPVETLPDGARIEGTVATFSYVGFQPGSGLSGGVSGGSDTTFRKDGTYTGSSFGGATAGFEGLGGEPTGGFTTGSTGKTGGTYDIRDGLLIQLPADGSAPRQSLIYRANGEVMIGDLTLKPGG